jgi:ATP-dependent DNA ligase
VPRPAKKAASVSWAERDPLEALPASFRARLRKRAPPTWVAPMLATLTDKPFSRQGWLFEPKLDGVRCRVFRRSGGLQLLSRNGTRLNERYPELVAAFDRQTTARFITDGEIVAFEGGVTSFAKQTTR